jgi:phage shock protein C
MWEIILCSVSSASTEYNISMEKRLYRSDTDRMIAGVCGGLAKYFGIDPVIIRLIALILLFTGPGLPVYLIMWIITPQKPAHE